jgi:hypothetical protein
LKFLYCGIDKGYSVKNGVLFFSTIRREVQIVKYCSDVNCNIDRVRKPFKGRKYLLLPRIKTSRTELQLFERKDEDNRKMEIFLRVCI